MREIDSHALRAQLVATAEVIPVRLWRLTALARQGGPEIAARVGAAAADIAALSSAAASELARTRVNAIDELGGLYAVQAMQERALGMIDALERGALDACLPDSAMPAQSPRASPPPPAYTMERVDPPPPRPLPRAAAVPQTPPRRSMAASGERRVEKPGPRVEDEAHEVKVPVSRRGGFVNLLPAVSKAVVMRVVAASVVLVAGGAVGLAYVHHGDRARAGWQMIADAVLHPMPAVAKSPPLKQAAASAEPAPAPPEPIIERETYAAVLMTGPDQRAVTAYFNDLRQSHPDLFATATARIQPVSGEGSGRQFRLAALPLRTKEQALKLCEALRARGVAGCLVRRM